MTLTKEKLMRLFGRINESAACHKHGGGSLAICPKCDVVHCLNCTSNCGCADTSMSATRAALNNLLQYVKACAESKSVPSTLNVAVNNASAIMSTPEEQQ